MTTFSMNFYPAIIIRIDKTKLMEYPIYKVVIDMEDEVTGLSAVSLVEHPAVERNFLLFKEDRMLFVADDEKQIISGVALLADTPIYRRNERGEYYVVFEKDIIRQLVEKYSKNGLLNSVNLQHNEHTFVNSVIMVESIIIDKERGVCPIEFNDCPDGSWIVSYHVQDKELWNEIKKGDWFRGFSVEITAGLELLETKEVEPKENENKPKKNKMNKLFKLAKTILKLADVVTDKATLIIEGEIEVGKPVFVEVEGEPIEAEDGEYTLEDGRVIVIEGGVIAEIRPVEEEKPVEAEETLEEEVTPEETPENEEIEGYKKRIEELEAEVADKDAKIAELEAEIATLKGTVAEQEEKLKMSVETPLTKKNKVENRENKALKYFS